MRQAQNQAGPKSRRSGRELKVGKKFRIKAGERKRVLWLFSSSVPGQPQFDATPIKGEDLSGKIEVVRSGGTYFFPLSRHNICEKGFLDANYKIYVTPDQDCEIAFQTRHFRAETLFIILALAVLFSGMVPVFIRLIVSAV